MRAVTLTGLGRLEVVEASVPRSRPGWSVVQVLACGICGTDRHILHGDYPARPPLILGHEFGGLLHEPSPDCPLPAGSMVSVDPNICCGDCWQCRDGSPALCAERIALGVDIDGGLAQYVLVPDTQIYRVPQHVDPLQLAFVEPLACCLRAIDLAGEMSGTRVAVVGGGMIGQLVVQLARSAGASTITLVTRQPFRQELGRSMGATWSGDMADRPSRDHDLVFECAGVPGTMTDSLDLARPGGSVILLGITGRDHLQSVSPFDLVVRELRLQGSFLNPRTQSRAVQLIADGTLNLDPLATRIVGWDEVVDGIRATPGPTDIKVILQPSA